MEQRLDNPAFRGGVLNGLQVPQTVDITPRHMLNFYERSLHVVPLGSGPSWQRPVGVWQISLRERCFKPFVMGQGGGDEQPHSVGLMNMHSIT